MPAPLYQVLPPSWHTWWIAITHDVNAVIARAVPRRLGDQFIVLARTKGSTLSRRHE